MIADRTQCAWAAGTVAPLVAVDFIRYWPEENVFRIGRVT